ncbi:MAG TPA: 50S ribosomal protein L3 [bacterium]|uniref:Large ribosomal subunit protein uL3 n=1 Tax=candidate division TA06 bacterium ADurb.Bin131 TaxID=1852827 RepID=A0A1V6C4E2_UNCT6|nr:MAG: 50S ribosomal protein L3 [candidate division TA06 bacterium ADurb.Bin131]HOC03014.1 50S ribosomal protein L3 [bacterium]HOQ82386.1 50S ribosomal protein L3 [bacterium]
MSMGLLGKKLGMTQIMEENGNMIPVTVLEIGPCFITQIKTKDVDGYYSIQIGYQEIPEKKSKKPAVGHCKKANLLPLKYLREIRINEGDVSNFSTGQRIDISIFKEGEYVDVCGKSIGKGFQGVVKRHNFKGGPASRGSMQHRKPGSIGGGTPQRVLKGKKMAGHMGNANVSVQNLKICKIIPDKNIVMVKGAVPGGENGIVFVRYAIKKQRTK